MCLLLCVRPGNNNFYVGLNFLNRDHIGELGAFIVHVRAHLGII